MTEEIKNHSDYLMMLAHVDQLFEDYYGNKQQLDRLVPLIEQYEATSPYFTDFNRSVAGISSSKALLQVLMDQHGLCPDDLSTILQDTEVVTAVLNGRQPLTPQHVSVLVQLFGFPHEQFFESGA